MILKGSQRGGGQDLAVHLMRTDDNEHVRVHELRGFAGCDLREAFKEAEAVARGTHCRQYLFSLSLSPPEDARVSVADFESAIECTEARLGLAHHPLTGIEPHQLFAMLDVLFPHGRRLRELLLP